jgi:ATP-dependent DNA helicase RecG
MDLLFERAIRHSKPLPDFTGSEAHKVSLTLHGTMTDPDFVRFLEKIGQENLASFSTRDFLALNLVHRNQQIPPKLRSNLVALIERGVLSVSDRQWDRQTRKELLLRRIRVNAGAGSQLNELMQVLPNLSRRQVQELVRELREEGQIHNRGSTRAARWYPGAVPTGE